MEPTAMRGAGAAGFGGVRRLRSMAALALAALAIAPQAFAEDVAAWLARAAAAARELNYVGTIAYQHGGRLETLRIVHLNDDGDEKEKLVNLDGPAREVIRTGSEVRCFYPEAKVLRVEPRALRNAFPSLSAAEQTALIENYEFRKAEAGRVAGLEAQAYQFVPKDDLRFGHKFWVDRATGLLLKARMANERGEMVEQFSFIDLSIGAKVDREMVQPTWGVAPPDWRTQKPQLGDIDLKESGWVVGKLPPGFTKIVEGYRPLRDHGPPVVQLVYSDGLVAVSVFIEKLNLGSVPRSLGASRQGGINVFIRPYTDRIVTVLGEVPAATVRQMALSIAHR